MTTVALWLLLLASPAFAWTGAKGYDDSKSPTWWAIPAASCVGTAAASNWDLPAADAPAAACITGTNTQKGVLDFDDGTTGTAPSAQQTVILPPDWVEGLGIVVNLRWLGVNTANEVRWCAQVICRADAETDDTAFDTAICVDDTAKGTTLQLNDATITLTGTSVDTCAAGELLHLKVYRDSDHANDDFAGNARLVSVRVGIFTAE